MRANRRRAIDQGLTRSMNVQNDETIQVVGGGLIEIKIQVPQNITTVKLFGHPEAFELAGPASS